MENSNKRFWSLVIILFTIMIISEGCITTKQCAAYDYHPVIKNGYVATYNK